MLRTPNASRSVKRSQITILSFVLVFLLLLSWPILRPDATAQISSNYALLGISTVAPGLSPADCCLDTSFGSGGRVTTDFGVLSSVDEARAIVLQSDGKIVVAGYADRNTNSANFALARYQPSGATDPSFGIAGKVVTDFTGLRDEAHAIALQPDGKIIVGGFANGDSDIFSGDFALVRYETNGGLDPSFGNGGKVTTDFNGRFDQINAVALQTDGKIVVAGAATSATSTQWLFALARYDSSGSLDPTFGSGGKVTTGFAPFSDEANAVALQNDGKIVVAGTADVRNNFSFPASNFALARYDTTGNLDSAFGSGGQLITDFAGGVDQAHTLVLQSDGKIVLGGKTTFLSGERGFRFALARYDTSGSLDSTFGNGGRVSTDVFGDENHAFDMLLQSDGKIILTGAVVQNLQLDFALTRYDNTGNPDNSFGTSGIITTDFSGTHDEAFATAQQEDGKIVVVGAAEEANGGRNFALARYVPSSSPTPTPTPTPTATPTPNPTPTPTPTATPTPTPTPTPPPTLLLNFDDPPERVQKDLKTRSISKTELKTGLLTEVAKRRDDARNIDPPDLCLLGALDAAKVTLNDEIATQILWNQMASPIFEESLNVALGGLPIYAKVLFKAGSYWIERPTRQDIAVGASKFVVEKTAKYVLPSAVEQLSSVGGELTAVFVRQTLNLDEISTVDLKNGHNFPFREAPFTQVNIRIVYSQKTGYIVATITAYDAFECGPTASRAYIIRYEAVQKHSFLDIHHVAGRPVEGTVRVFRVPD